MREERREGERPRNINLVRLQSEGRAGGRRVEGRRTDLHSPHVTRQPRGQKLVQVSSTGYL